MIPLLLLFALQQTPAPLAVRELAIEPVPHHLAVAALGADGGNRLVSVSGRTLRLVEEPDLRLALAGDSVLWTIADLDRDGRSEFLLLVDGMELRAVERIIATAGGADRLVLSAPILSALKALPPRGVHQCQVRLNKTLYDNLRVHDVGPPRWLVPTQRKNRSCTRRFCAPYLQSTVLKSISSNKSGETSGERE